VERATLAFAEEEPLRSLQTLGLVEEPVVAVGLVLLPFFVAVGAALVEVAAFVVGVLLPFPFPLLLPPLLPLFPLLPPPLPPGAAGSLTNLAMAGPGKL